MDVQKKKPFYKKGWFWALIIILGVFGNALSDEEEQQESKEEIVTNQEKETDTKKDVPKIKKKEEVTTKKAEEKEIDKQTSEKNKNEKEDLPEINENAMEHAYSIINGYDMVRESLIKVDKEKKVITLVLVVNHATNKEHAMNLGDNFARALSSGFSIYNEEKNYASPTKDNLGELYDYYDLHIGVGTGPDNFIARGAKVTQSPVITW